MIEELFSETAAKQASAAGSVQWRTHTLQLVNWGGFHGHKAVAITDSSTLLTGASGTGKSTLLDAYLALMMPSDTPFNAASNDAVVGRARSQNQRTVLTYLRGKTDTERESGTGELRDKELRPGLTWGALSMTFAADNGRLFTVLRTYFVPKTATRFAELGKKLATFDGYLDLRDLQNVVDSRFDGREMKKQFPGINIFETYDAFAQNLYTRLGIGAHGRGDMALRLLARIQGGQQVKTVDGLYKQMVLEKPSTYDKANHALKHFKALEDSYLSMRTEAEKREVLQSLPGLQGQIVEAMDTSDRINEFKHDRDATTDTPFKLWRLRTEFDLLDHHEAMLHDERAVVSATFAREQQGETKLRAELAANLQEQRDNGGGTIERLELELKGLRQERSQVEQSIAAYEAHTQSLGPSPRTRGEFEAIQSAARTFMDEYEVTASALNAKREALNEQRWPLSQRMRDLTRELDSLQQRAGLVPERMDTARRTIAAHVGMNPDDLPFLAELIDVKPGEERWRKAIEVSLFGPVRTMLVDETHLSYLSRSIDELKLSGVRLQFEGVPLTEHADANFNPERISGKLVFKPSRFSGWAQARVQRGDALCVEDPRDLDGHGARVTLNGQTRNGKRGAHGELKERPVIGFSNEDRKQDLAEELDAASALNDHLTAQADAVRAESDDLRRLHDAHAWVLATRWETLDLQAIDEAITSRQADLDSVLANSDILKTLRAAEERLTGEIDQAAAAKYGAKNRLADLEKSYIEVIDSKDDVSRAVDAIESAQTVVLTEDQTTYLDNQYAEVVGDEPATPARFQSLIRQLTKALSDRMTGARRDLERASAAMLGCFREYQGRWRDDSLGDTLQAYDRYKAILDNIEAGGLHERQEAFNRQVAKWSSEDLVPLNDAFSIAVEEIQDRLHPINEILKDLPFGANDYRLRINLRVLAKDDMKVFRARLKRLSSETVSLATATDIENRFNDIRTFMRTIEDGASSRDYYLDVRKHVDITAVATDLQGVERATYDSLGGKSGGETQELVAFIVGAALRFQLGDEERDRPRFAPVFLDEGFVKSDSEFAGRAVAAWQGLGFQLIIGAPLDKVNALEPAMDQVLLVTKSPDGRSQVSVVKPKVKA